MKRWQQRPDGSTWGDWGDDDELGQPARQNVALYAARPATQHLPAARTEVEAHVLAERQSETEVAELLGRAGEAETGLWEDLKRNPEHVDERAAAIELLESAERHVDLPAHFEKSKEKYRIGEKRKIKYTPPKG